MTPPVRINGPYSVVDLVLVHRPESTSRLPSDEELEASWMAKRPSKVHVPPKTPTRPGAGLVVGWSPSMETPQDTDAPQQKPIATSPGLFGSPTAVVLIDSDGDPDDLPSLSQLGLRRAFKSISGHGDMGAEGQHPVEVDSLDTQLPAVSPEPITAHMEAPAVVTTNIGFTTGSGKKIKSPSKAAREKADVIMKMVDSTPPPKEAVPETPKMASGFTSASGKSLKTPSTNSVAKAEALLKDIVLQSPCPDPSPLSRKLCSSPAKRLSDAPQSVAKQIKFDQLISREFKATSWREYFKCSPCRDLDLAVLSGVYHLPFQ